MSQEIRGVTWDLVGQRLQPWQAAQRLFKAGFTDARQLTVMWAVLEAESARYLKAWHHNVSRDRNGNILKDNNGNMTVLSTDLGFIQRNVQHAPTKTLAMTNQDAQAFVDELFAAHDELSWGDQSAAIAKDLFDERGFQPWFAHTNGSYRKFLPQAIVAVGNFLGVSLLNDPDVVRLI